MHVSYKRIISTAAQAMVNPALGKALTNKCRRAQSKTTVNFKVSMNQLNVLTLQDGCGKIKMLLGNHKDKVRGNPQMLPTTKVQVIFSLQTLLTKCKLKPSNKLLTHLDQA